MSLPRGVLLVLDREPTTTGDKDRYIETELEGSRMALHKLRHLFMIGFNTNYGQ